MVDVALSLLGSNGDAISLEGSEDYYLQSGVSGFGIPATNVRIDQSAADGGVWRNTRRGVREVDMPIVTFGATREEVENKLRRLANLLHDNKGATTIRASYSDGTAWHLQGHYVAGAETTFGSDAGEHWARWVVSLQCPVPFWVRTSSEQYNLGTGATGRSLIPNLAELRISSSQAIGIMQVENPGDVAAYPVWQFTGPTTNITITSEAGQVFSYVGAIASGVKVFVDTFAGTVKDASGVNLYSNLGASPKLFPIPSGSSQVTVTATGADSNTLLSLYFQPRREVIH